MWSRNPSEVDRNPSLYPNVSFPVLQSAPGLVGLGASGGVGVLGCWGDGNGARRGGVISGRENGPTKGKKSGTSLRRARKTKKVSKIKYFLSFL